MSISGFQSNFIFVLFLEKGSHYLELRDPPASVSLMLISHISVWDEEQVQEMIDGSLASRLKKHKSTYISVIKNGTVVLRPTSGVCSPGNRVQGFMHASQTLYHSIPVSAYTIAVLRSGI